jgi:hippurate hydrolase
MINELIAIRHDLHMHPELAFEEHRTAGIVARELANAGFKVETGVASTGVVGTITHGTSRKVIAIRADMDALPIHELTNLKYSSRTAGKMHACGHDGHTTMLLGLARHLAKTKNFDGTVHLIFQPAEEAAQNAWCRRGCSNASRRILFSPAIIFRAWNWAKCACAAVP